jgi:hypothetical protein
MKFILVQTARTVVSVIFIYGTLIVASFLIIPKDNSSEILDTSLAENTVYATSAKYLFFGRGTLVKPERRVLIVGASNADLGMRPKQLQEHIPCALVSNLSLGNENATEMQQTVDLVHFMQDPETRLQDTFVFGIWYGVFGSSEDRWPLSSRKDSETDIDLELYRYGFYHRTSEGPRSLFPPAWLPVEATLIRPFLVAENIARRLTEKLRGYFFIRPPKRTDAEREASHFSLQERNDAIAYWQNQMGHKDDISAEQFARFESMIEHLLDAHEKVVVADLPIPQWHQRGIVYDSKYRLRLPELLKKFEGREGFAFSNISELDMNDDYSDEVHPKPHLAKIWAERIGKTINSIACPAAVSALPK